MQKSSPISDHGSGTLQRQSVPIDRLHDFFAHYLQITRESYKQFEANLVPIGLCGAIAMPLYYIIWQDLFPQDYENLPLRLVGSLMCLLVALKDRWPQKIRNHVPLLWHLTLLYILPFFFTFMLLMNDVSPVWLVTWLCGLFMLVVALDWINVIIFLVIGVLAAWGLFEWVGGGQMPSEQIYEQLPVFLFALVIGTLFSYRQGAARRERLAAMLSVSRGLSRELNAPLRTITASTVGLKQYLPVLLQTYDEADTADSGTMRIPASHRRALDHSISRIQTGVEQANTVIQMLMQNSQFDELSLARPQLLSMSDCIKSALERYPFSSDMERKLVKWRQGQDFSFHGEGTVMVFVLMNLIKASLLAVARSGKGEVTIFIEADGGIQRLVIHQSGWAAPQRYLATIFEEMSVLEGGSGTGAGLLFAKRAIETMGGRIECLPDSAVGTKFSIRLPSAAVSDH